MEIEFFIERDEQEIMVVVTFAYEKACRGHCDRYGAPEEPDTPESLDIESVLDENGNDVELTESEIDSAMQQGWDALENQREY